MDELIHRANPSPNHDERALPISMVVLHYTGMPTGAEAEERLVDPEAVTGSIADDAQAYLGLLARDAMLAVDTWTRLVYLSSRKNE